MPEKVRITVLDYSEAGFEEREIDDIEECFPFKDKPTVTWFNIDGIHDVDLIEKLGSHFGLHPLVLEDIVTAGQRPKMEDYDSYVYLVIRMLSYDGEAEGLADEQVSLVLGNNFVISFQERVGDVLDPIRKRIRSGKGRIRKMSADYLAYAILDTIVDNYFLALEKVGERVELIEDEVVENPTPLTLQEIHTLKREMIFFRKSAWPLREVVGGLERGESTLIRRQSAPFLRDLYDHSIRVIDTVETYRDVLSGMLDIYISSVSNRMNEIMKVLTVIATVFIPITFLAGIWGMNFQYMPELKLRIGYPLALTVMFGLALVMLIYFRRKKWF